ncbi:MAG: hypothetical protein H0T73_11600 [Ardenticatenales bacterium]|nr:hypothetical protein [Ardenticatenales bacterium]
MTTYKRHITIQDPNRLILSDLPFQPGQRVQVILTTEEGELSSVDRLRTLFKRTQALPSARAISEEEIAAEITAYRAEQS